MKVRISLSAALLAASAGLATAVPQVDGSFDANDGGDYSDQLWVNDLATQFGDNAAGIQDAGQDGGLVTIGDPAGVTTGFEFSIPLADLGSPAGAFSMGGWINSGDRTFLSNQFIHDGNLVQNTGNLGSAIDFVNNGFVPAVSVTPVSVMPGDITIDGTRDAAYGAAQFVQNNYTQFGNATQGETDNAFGSEIDALYVASDGTNLYVMVTGNVEGNGNGLDLWFDTTAGGMGTLNTSSATTPRMVDDGMGGMMPDTSISQRLANQDGTVFGGSFAPDYYITVDGINGAGNRVYYSDLNAAMLTLLIPGDGTYASDGTLTDPDAGAPAMAATIDNSNVDGVPGAEIGTDLPDIPPSPASPDASYAYGSELNNLRFFIDDNRADMMAPPAVGEATLYLFIGGNIEKNSNRLYLFLDSQPGGQNVMRGDNVDIAFGALNNKAGLTFDAGFEPDQWLTINIFESQDNVITANFSESAVLRTDGPLLDPFFGVSLDYASFDGGDREVDDGMGGTTLTGEFPVDYGLDGAGVDDLFEDPFAAANPLGVQSNFGPRQSQIAFDTASTPAGGLILYAVNNSNVGGVAAFVDGTSEDNSDAANVSTGFEIAIDLAELGWDGVSDIKVGGMIGNSGGDFMSNQVIGGLPAGTANLGDPANIDFTTIAGDQFVVLADDACPADQNGDGIFNNTDINLFVSNFLGMQPAGDINGDGNFNNTDINLFVTLFLNQCS